MASVRRSGPMRAVKPAISHSFRALALDILAFPPFTCWWRSVMVAAL